MTLSLCRAHYVIICEHVFAGLEVFLGGRGGQCHCYLRRMFSKDSESSFNTTHLISHWKGHRGEALLRGFKQPPLLKRYSSVVLCVRDFSRYFVTLCNVYYERTAALPLHRDSLYSSNVAFYVKYHLIPSVYDSTISLSFNLC